jgi:hypothetical protein
MDIKSLDSPIKINGITRSLRDIVLSLTNPISPEEGEATRVLFHSVDRPSTGNDRDKNAVFFTAYHDQADLAEQIVAILPAYINQFVSKEAAKVWFIQGSLEALNDVHFQYDDDGNWLGTWTTEDDALHLDIMNEDMGIEIEFEGLSTLERDCVLLTTDNATVHTFGTELEREGAKSTQQTESAILAGDAATLDSSSGGSAV